MTQDASDRHSFILRIWRETKNQEWKGWVQHANSGESIPFHTMTDLLAFIERYKGEPAPPAPQDRNQNSNQSNSGLK
ncbi:MAG: hypothetical protein JXA78_18860 [Anaerolineales bacterium]|nr:hypothetical protein [Anaerolineales bacterium]